MLLIVGGLIIAVGTIVLVWDVLVLIGMTVALIATLIWTAVCALMLLFAKLYEWGQRLNEWDKSRSGQRWEPIQTEVYGDQHALETQMEDLVWNHRMFTVTREEDGKVTTWDISLAELLKLEEADDSVKEGAVRQFLTMVKDQMSPDQVEQVIMIIRNQLKVPQRLTTAGVVPVPLLGLR
jgi:hypothetical protein